MGLPGGGFDGLNYSTYVAAGVLWGATTLAIRGTRLESAAAEKTLLYQLAVSGVMAAASLADRFVTEVDRSSWMRTVAFARYRGTVE